MVLLIMRGYPGSGKTTWAEAWVAMGHGRARVNRDDLRNSIFGKYTGLSNDEEMAVTRAQKATVESLLKKGYDVVVDDTSLRLKTARDWADFARSRGHEFEVRDVTTDWESCVQRDVYRSLDGGRFVGRGVIESFAKRYPMPWPEVKATVDKASLPAPYEPNQWAPTAIIVDLDGTLALHNGRSPYDYSKVSTDKPNHPVRNLVWDAARQGVHILFTTGRPESAREDTLEWLRWHLTLDLGAVKNWQLFMRPDGDQRPDYIVKGEIFDKEIRDKYAVECALDDRNQVVEMWRSIGVPCLQVAEGNF